ncbi:MULTISPECIES: Tn7-like element transposition protein TnsE [Gammaproteobacteria]|uniref:Tn7-like element transposition protein TnsE n=1 Tax=Gammaproteobacteria TaxID=1236 RepID=UPI001CF0056D|nr:MULTISPECIES: Tn7-like element transposition protein TnsE [Gammaproteobacteria]MDR9983641.1 Tn7-like element transposition protein TnsE [Enterobacter hormaechei subsp. steigerwaltii]UCM45185.1 Tn7-like element transposition protein TnsE [Aeromonas dhakensis]
MNESIQLKGFKDDTWINGIGNFYRKKDGVQWGINLSVHPRGESGKDSTTLSNAPILVRKRKLNPTQEYSRRGFEKNFTISTSLDWQIDLLGNCPALERLLPKEAKQYCFVFQLNDGTRIYLPQFELARVLFFKNGYLARSSVVHDLLSNEFILEYDEENDKAIVNVLDSFSGNWELFNDYGHRRLLAWLLMDPEARRSYDSIGRYQLTHGYDVGQYRYWDFLFDPPALEDVWMKVKGNFDVESRTLLVHEIMSIRNVPVNIPGSVEFFSPKFYIQLNGKGQGNEAVRPLGHKVDDAAEESRENKPVLLEGYATEFEFGRAIETSKICEKEKPTGRCRKDDSEPDEASSDVSTEAQSPGGDLPSADWDDLNDQTDDAHLYLNKFYSFFKMLDLLHEKHCCLVVKFPLRKLPAIGKCKKHLLGTDKNPRCMSVVHVTAGGAGYYLLEVDTSDASKALSTKVIRASAVGDIETHLFEIERQLLKASLSWPKEFLDKLVGEQNHTWIPHQKSDKTGALTTSEIEKWASRISIFISS